MLEPAAISVPSESSPESFACGSVLPDTHADDESPDWPESCRICIAENTLLRLLLSWPAAQKPLPLRILCCLFYAVVWVMVVMVMVMVMTRCGWGDIV